MTATRRGGPRVRARIRSFLYFYLFVLPFWVRCVSAERSSDERSGRLGSRRLSPISGYIPAATLHLLLIPYNIIIRLMELFIFRDGPTSAQDTSSISIYFLHFCCPCKIDRVSVYFNTHAIRFARSKSHFMQERPLDCRGFRLGLSGFNGDRRVEVNLT